MIVPSLLLLLVLLTSSPAAAAQTHAYIACTDFSTGCLSAVNLSSQAVSSCVQSIHSDPRLRWYNGLVYVVNRFGQDNIQVIDPAQA